MIVEDHPDQRRIYGSLLWYNGFNVFTVPNATSAKRALAFLRPDLILLDLGLPDGDGLEICAAAQRFGGRPIPVVALSAYPTRQMKTLALAAGCARYLEKSFTSPLDVLHEVEDILGKAPPSGDGATSWMLDYPMSEGTSQVP
jgi:CheY-like chemotaxis protein